MIVCSRFTWAGCSQYEGDLSARTMARFVPLVLALPAALSLFCLSTFADDDDSRVSCRSAWADPAAEVVFSERFEDPASRGLRLLTQQRRVHSSGVGTAAGPAGCNAHVLDVDIPGGEEIRAVFEMPETDPRGLSYRFSLKIETDPEMWTAERPSGQRFLQMLLNHSGASDSIYSAEPLEYPQVKDSVWLERATEAVFKSQAEHIHQGWTRYEGNTANAFRRRYDGREVGQPLAQVIHLILRNVTKDTLRVRVGLADIAVIRQDIDNLPELKTFLAASSPFIFQTREQLLLARERIAAGMPMPQSMARDLRRATVLLATDIVVPRKQAGWPSAVTCETTGCKGRPLPEPPVGYRCRECGKMHTGDRIDGLLVYEQHRANSEAVRLLGFAWQGFDDERYARKAEAILLEYASAIADFKLGHNWLGDCWLMEDMLAGYDYIREWVAPETRRVIEQDFLMPMLRRIYHYNHHYPEGYTRLLKVCTWCALLSRDVDWIYNLVVSPSGNRDVVMRHGLTDDFISLKGAAYHGGLVRGISELGQSIENCGIRFFDDSVHPLYLAIPRQLFPDGSLPAFGHANVGVSAGDYGLPIAYRYYRDPILLATLSPEFRADPSARIFWEEPTLPPARPFILRSTNFPALGLTMLRTRDNSSVLALNWGAPQRNDPSRLDFQFYGAGGQLLWGSGVTGYTNPLFSRWYQKSISRNGLVVDEQTQEPRAGKLLLLNLEAPDQVVAAELVDAYPDSRWLRIAVLFEDGAALLLDRLATPMPRTVDWVCQLPGTVSTSLRVASVATPFSPHNGYGVLKDIRVGDASRPYSIALQPAPGNSAVARGVRITPAPTADARFFLGQGRTGHAALESPVGIIRREGVRDAVFAVLLEPFNRESRAVSQVSIQEATERGGQIVVQRRNQNRLIRFQENPERPPTAADRLSVVIQRQ
jgi:hypothetical protein